MGSSVSSIMTDRVLGWDRRAEVKEFLSCPGYGSRSTRFWVFRNTTIEDVERYGTGGVGTETNLISLNDETLHGKRKLRTVLSDRVSCSSGLRERSGRSVSRRETSGFGNRKKKRTPEATRARGWSSETA